MWTTWRAVTGEWCISDPYGITVTIGGREEMEALIEELQKTLEESKTSEE
ncbi:MAG: hypothetical protein NWE76_03600 [Candidatus Bathyarchaeota archaeon]|jgi:hypothetical protein|nr:hypothetical protein [Candidatus Bathyarchaeota archaeon]